MKKIFLFALLINSLLLTSCNYTCENNQQGACLDQVPTNEACTAYFQRWFYNSSTNTCELKSYSGCSQKGFATEAECNACKCH